MSALRLAGLAVSIALAFMQGGQTKHMSQNQTTKRSSDSMHAGVSSESDSVKKQKSTQQVWTLSNSLRIPYQTKGRCQYMMLTPDTSSLQYACSLHFAVGLQHACGLVQVLLSGLVNDWLH